jgi:hypothetical protein
MDAALETKPDDAPEIAAPEIAAPDIVAPGNNDDIETLLAEFTNQTSQQPPVQDDAIANLLRDPADERRIGELTGQLDGLRGEVHRKSEIEAFDKYSAEVQARLPEHLPPDYAKNALLSAAATNPDLQAAWNYRGITPEQRRTADSEFRQLEILHGQVSRSPDSDPRKASALAQIEQAGQRLGLMMNSQQILRNLERDIVKRAADFKPIDQDATADHFAVAQAVRDGGGKVTAEPPPNLGRMSDNELREFTRKNYGFV